MQVNPIFPCSHKALQFALPLYPPFVIKNPAFRGVTNDIKNTTVVSVPVHNN